MENFGARTRFATLLVVGTVSLITGIAAGGLGGYLALGERSDAGTRDTSLRTNSSGDGLSVTQEGTGVAIRGSAASGTGIAGAFTNSLGTGVAAVVGGADGFAIYAGNDSPVTGAGGAVRVDGQENVGVVATSGRASAVVARSTGGQAAIVGSSPSASAVRASASGAGPFDDCGRLPCAGVSATGSIGVLATTGSAGGAGVYAGDQSTDRSGYALVAAGDTVISGSMFVGAGCVGCTPLAIARNGSDLALHQGDAVELLGLDAAAGGVTVLIVGPAAQGRAVIGVVDRAFTRLAPPAGPDEVGGKWREGDIQVPAGATMRIVISGIMTLDRPIDGALAGNRLAVGTNPGRLVVASDGTVDVGRYLGIRPDGRGVLLVDPD